ncbi:MAG: FHA domain-containing protein [Planctomycetales bacterium]|nr:FHA domain-containing protein [Planctomycetales bacterium]
MPDQPQQSWNVGSDSSCDIVVKSGTVSGRHCCLKRDGAQLILVDLDSTNGTFVNGRRVHGSTSVSTTDRVTLGQTTIMPWPKDLLSEQLPQRDPMPGNQNLPHDGLNVPTTPRRIITIGRGADNTVVLGEPNVSTHHARLVINGNEIVLEDLGSTNGTSVGKVENKIASSVVRKNDTVFLGSTAYQVSDLLRRSSPTFVETAQEPADLPKTFHSPAGKRSPGIPIITAAVGSLAILTIGWLVMRNPVQQNPAPNLSVTDNPSASETDQTSMATSASIAVIDDLGKNPPVFHNEEFVESAPPAGSMEGALSADERLANCLYVIVCADSERKTPFRVGTGFAIDSDHIATSATVIQAIGRLQQSGFPDTFLYSPASKSEREITSMKSHRHYLRAGEIAHKAQQEYDSLYDELESTPPKPDDFETVKGRLIEARMRALRALDQKTSYDVAVIKLNKPVVNWLTGAESGVRLRPNQKLNVVGCAFDIEDPYFDSTVDLDVVTMAGRFGQLVKSSADEPPRIVARGAKQQTELAFLGSPIMNAQGQVAGIYSRPSPPNGDEESESDLTFEAAMYERIDECLAQPD